MKKFTNSVFTKFVMLVVFIVSFIVSPQITLGAGPTATLQVVVNVLNNNGGTNTPSSFGINISGAGASPSIFNGSGTGTTVVVNAGQPYTTSVSTLSYLTSFSPDCNSTLVANDVATCTITLNDIAPLLPGQNPENLIANPMFENPSTTDPNIPLSWNKGYANPSDVVTYTYPVADAPASDISSGNAAKITATTLATGSDAKWYFDPVPVIAGRQYHFSDSYISTIDTDIVAAFCTDVFQSNCVYQLSSSVPATQTNVWGQSSVVFTVPDGKTYMTIFHRVSAPGTLIVDNYSATLVPPPSPFSYGFVSLTFDDGLLSQYNNARNVLLTGNAKGTFFIPTHFISGFSISNPSVEYGTTSPTDWSHSGSNSATYTYETDAHTGLRSAKTSSTTVGSNAAWYFDPVTVIPDSIYNFSEFYKSTGNSELIAQLTMADGTTQTAQVTDISGNFVSNSVLLSPSANYTQIQKYFYIPLNTSSITILNRLTGIGSVTIDDVSLGRVGYMTSDQILNLQNDGNEIGGHTQTHPDLTQITTEEINSEINFGRTDLLDNLMSPVLSLAYPFGAFNQAVQQALSSAGYTSGRTIIPGFNGKDTSKYSLLSESVNADTTINQIESWINTAKADKTWLILTFHDIQSDLTNVPYGATPQTLADTIAYINSQSVPIKAVSQGIDLMNDMQPTPVDICPNVTGVQTTGPCADTLCLSPNTWNMTNQTCDVPVIITPVDICTNVTGVQTILPCADTLCLSPNTWNTGTQTCDAPVIIVPPVVPPTTTTPPATPQNSITFSGSIPFSSGKVLGSTKFIFTKRLKQGSRGDEVMELQKFLNNAGYPVKIDGVFGSATTVALIKFQIANGLKGDGIVGVQTRAVLNK